MRHATIIAGAYADAFSKDAAQQIVNQDGSLNWGAAFRADPGVKSCPVCKAHYWNEAKVMQCPDCQTYFGDGFADSNPKETP
jgi:hypothetical protein